MEIPYSLYPLPAGRQVVAIPCILPYPLKASAYKLFPVVHSVLYMSFMSFILVSRGWTDPCVPTIKTYTLTTLLRIMSYSTTVVLR